MFACPDQNRRAVTTPAEMEVAAALQSFVALLGRNTTPMAPVSEVLARFGERLSRDLLVLVHRVGAGDRGRRRIDRPNE